MRVYGQTQHIDRDGKVGVKVKAEDPVIRVPREDLRAAPEDLWQAVQARLGRNRQAYVRSEGNNANGETSQRPGTLRGRPAGSDFESPYLLTSFLRCKRCGGAMGVARSLNTKSGSMWLGYKCVNAKKGTCSNRRAVRHDVVERTVAQVLVNVFGASKVREAVEEALQEPKRRAGSAPRETGRPFLEPDVISSPSPST